MTDFLIITSTEDKASMNIRNILLDEPLFTFEEYEKRWHDYPLLELKMVLAKIDYEPFFTNNRIFLGLTDSPLIQLSDLQLKETGINPDLCIFASRHRSEAARPAFLAHSTGNWTDKAEYGGKPYDLSKTSAILITAAYRTLKTQRSIKNITDFKVDIEVTHHGPTSLEKPLIFLELGSSEKEWELKQAGMVVAHSSFLTCYEYEKVLKDLNYKPKIGIGFGGTHYAPQFSKILDLNPVALSFICPKYYIQNLTKEMIQLMIDNTFESIEMFLIDWKGTNSADKQHLIPLLEEFDLPIKKTKEF